MNRSRQETPGRRNAQPEGSPVPTLSPWDTPVFVPESAILRVLFERREAPMPIWAPPIRCLFVRTFRKREVRFSGF